MLVCVGQKRKSVLSRMCCLAMIPLPGSGCSTFFFLQRWWDLSFPIIQIIGWKVEIDHEGGRCAAFSSPLSSSQGSSFPPWLLRAGRGAEGTVSQALCASHFDGRKAQPFITSTQGPGLTLTVSRSQVSAPQGRGLGKFLWMT